MAQELTQLSVPNFPAELEEILKREAKRQDRSLASLLRTILADYASKVRQSADGETAYTAA
jgi:hypothetical protein